MQYACRRNREKDLEEVNRQRKEIMRQAKAEAAKILQEANARIEKYIKQNHDVIINKEKELEIYKKANKILKLVEKGYKNLVFPDIINIKNELIKEKIKR